MAAALSGQRYAPPAAVECNRNDLTSYIGKVIRYHRDGGRIRITVRTDEETEETAAFAPADKKLIDGEPMNEAIGSRWKRAREGSGRDCERSYGCAPEAALCLTGGLRGGSRS
jgi:hypothetical protein